MALLGKASAVSGCNRLSLTPVCCSVVVSARRPGVVRTASHAQEAEPVTSNSYQSARTLAPPSKNATLASTSEVQDGERGWWGKLPARRKLTLTCAGALALSNMDKVNLTLAILPMAEEMGWNATTMGLVQSAFFYGFLLMQLPGGALCSKVGGRSVLPLGVSVWSAATFFAPLLAGNIVPFCTSRVVMGLGEAVAPSAIVDILAKSVPKEERASSISTAFGGLHVGSIVGLLAAPPIICNFGWQGVFYAFGGAGLIWYLCFEGLLDSLQKSEPEVVTKLQGSEAPSSSAASSSALSDIPYRAMLRSRSVQVLAATHFAHNWFHYTMLAWLPTYFVSALNVDLMHAATTALLPPIAGIFASAAAGTLADKLVSDGMKAAHVRKLAQCTAFLIPSVLLLGTCVVPCTPEDNFMSVAMITMALGISSFSLAGLYCTHQDLSPKYASTLLGMTNVAASIPGIVGVAAVGAIYEATQSWEVALFLPSALFMTLGAGLYTVAGTHEQIEFDELDNSPLAVESSLEPVKRWASSVNTSSRNVLGWLRSMVPDISNQKGLEDVLQQVESWLQNLWVDGSFAQSLDKSLSSEPRQLKGRELRKPASRLVGRGSVW